MGTETTRRAILGGAGIVAALTAAPIPAKAATGTAPSATVSPELARLIGDARHADAAASAFYENVYNPAAERRDAAVAAVPHTSVTVPSTSRSDRPNVWSTDNPTAVAICQALSRRSEAPFQTPEVRGRARQIVAAHHRRQRAIKRVAKAHDTSAMGAECDRLASLTCEAEYRVANFTPVTLTDLHAKVAFMAKREMGDGFDLLPMFLADVSQVLAAELTA